MNKNAENLKILYDIVGADSFVKIVDRLAGENIYITDCGGYPSKEIRNHCIKNDFFAGLSQDELATKYDLSIQSIYKIVESR
ncbi:MAG: hypothetical protein J6D02_09295 [Lachnospira sp.]|nr:hypothetical protein [Lachnospira sp.]